MDGAERELRLPPAIGSFVLPLAVSTFKVHRTIADPVELLFLAHLYRIHLEPAQIATFLMTVLILSFSAVGIPIEGVVLLKTVDVIPDIFKTLLNVTGDMTVAIVARLPVLRPRPDKSRRVDAGRAKAPEEGWYSQGGAGSVGCLAPLLLFQASCHIAGILAASPLP